MLSFLFLLVRRLNKRQALQESAHKETDTEDVWETISHETTHTFLCLENARATDSRSQYSRAHVTQNQLSGQARLLDARTGAEVDHLIHMMFMNRIE